ncbi:MAG: N-acetylmuramoyl-L-alanine amidase [Lachnospiraceae bacterium]|nr:N-acetylmuramoyl-L-alanine amidase [Lachnospiraceae bacterium]
MNDSDRKDVYKIERLISTLFLLIFVSLCIFFLIVPDFHSKAALWKARIYGKNEWEITKEFEGNKSVYKLGLPKDFDESGISVDTDIKNSMVSIYLPGTDAAYPKDYSMMGHFEPVSKVMYEYGKKGCTMKFKMTKIFFPEIKVKDDYLTINFKDQKDVYKNIVLIDASLGGEQSGAVFDNAKEKNINLSIVKKMKAILDKEAPKDSKIYYTRLKDDTISEEKRVAMVNTSGCDYFLSIGLNQTSSGRISDMNGVATYYISTNPRSKNFANDCLNSLLEKTQAQNRGVIAGDEIRLLEATNSDSVLARVGYSTNEEERAKLTQDDYQNTIARGLCDAILKNIKGE